MIEWAQQTWSWTIHTLWTFSVEIGAKQVATDDFSIEYGVRLICVIVFVLVFVFVFVHVKWYWSAFQAHRDNEIKTSHRSMIKYSNLMWKLLGATAKSKMNKQTSCKIVCAILVSMLRNIPMCRILRIFSWFPIISFTMRWSSTLDIFRRLQKTNTCAQFCRN